VENLQIIAATNPCPADAVVSDQQALMDILKDD